MSMMVKNREVGTTVATPVRPSKTSLTEYSPSRRSGSNRGHQESGEDPDARQDPYRTRRCAAVAPRLQHAHSGPDDQNRHERAATRAEYRQHDEAARERADHVSNGVQRVHAREAIARSSIRCVISRNITGKSPDHAMTESMISSEKSKTVSGSGRR